ncbi:MAG TPA: hypothetical protein PKD49_07465 [Hyphomicrobium sp.]|nr:hypothetical protein [Hyphomicrobium sp.]
MNAPSFDDLRANGRDLSDEKMEQVRELLFGDAIRILEARLRQLEMRLSEIETGLGRQLGNVESRLQALAGSAEADRRAAFEALARSISDLGEQVHRISRG